MEPKDNYHRLPHGKSYIKESISMTVKTSLGNWPSPRCSLYMTGCILSPLTEPAAS